MSSRSHNLFVQSASGEEHELKSPAHDMADANKESAPGAATAAGAMESKPGPKPTPEGKHVTIKAGPTLNRSESMPTAELRTVFLNNPARNSKIIQEKRYSSNTVSTSKYSILSFVPKNLMEFFKIIANIYFLVISALQVGTDLSPTNPYTTITPLTIVLMITMAKQGVEDYKRHKADHTMNNRPAQVVRDGGRLQTVAWSEIVVGDVLVVKDREELPADIVLLASSEEEGRCFIETANLDGETNLKRRQCLKATSRAVGWRGVGEPVIDPTVHYDKVAQLTGDITYEEKNNSLYTFVGALKLAGDDTGTIPIGPSSVILRGCMLRSCSYVLGIVIYTGADTKLMQNSRPTPSKQSNVYKMVNRCIMLIFVTQFVLCLISTIAFGVWSGNNEGEGVVWYMGDILKETTATEVFTSFFTFLILYNNLVPISLYVSLDMIKVVQAKMIEHDPEMLQVNEETGEHKYAKARTSDLNEDLGQIEYIFSDKTGTLTCNMMEFRKCAIAGVAYGFGTTEIGEAAAARGGVSASDAEELSAEQIAALSDPRKAQVHYDPTIHFDDPRMLETLRQKDTLASFCVDEFLTLLSVCHTVIPEKIEGSDKVAYRAASPDEEALVKAAKCLGYDFVSPAPFVKVEVKLSAGDKARVMEHEVLNVNEFNSTRKRMSVVVKTKDDKYILYCKGADNVMFERSTSVIASDEPSLKKHLRKFASEGLRTLVLARRELSKEEYQSWNDLYTAAAASLEDRDHKLMEVAEKLEVNLEIIGATAIEDKLQDGVPQAISDLAQAGIKIWVLTGDKQETAINIGYACQLLTNEMQLIYVNAHHLEEIQSQLNALESNPSIQPLIERNETSEALALIVDGTSLTKIFTAPGMSPRRKAACQALQLQLLNIARCCKAVVACRVSPAQKAAIVSLVRTNVSPPPMTLAIGDGANDVNMIQTAQVGVGISGQEGVQAVNSSDYAIAQFRFLRHLLLCHGRVNYQRIAKVIVYSFYKNIALVMVLFLFNFYNGFSGTTLFESFVMAGWNFFLAMPIIIIGVVDFDVHDHVALANPALYMSGQWSLDLNVKTFTHWIGNAFIHALLTFFLPLPMLSTVWADAGTSDGLFVIGTTVYSCLLMTMNYKVALETRAWTPLSHFFWWGSVALYFVFLCVYTLMADVAGSPGFVMAAYEMFSRPMYWALVIFVPTVAILLDVAYMHLTSQINPTPHEVMREKARYCNPGEVPSERVSRGAPSHASAGAVAPDVDGSKAKSVRIDESAAASMGVVDLQSAPHTGFAYNYPVQESHFAASMAALKFISRSRRHMVNKRGDGIPEADSDSGTEVPDN